MKEITVHLKGGLNKYLNRPVKIKIQKSDIDTIASLLEYLHLKKSVLSVILQNGKQVDIEDKIKEEAVIILYPIFGGG